MSYENQMSDHERAQIMESAMKAQAMGHQRGLVDCQPSEPRLRQIIQRLEELQKVSYHHYETLGTAADRICGACPEANGAGSPSSLPNGLLSEIDDLIDGVTRNLGRIGEQASRLSSIG